MNGSQPVRRRRRGGPPEEPRADKLGAVIAKQIEAEVLRGGWRIGQSLGSEPELMQRYHVSRSTLREAIRQSESHGFVKMLRGVGGGLIVAAEAHEAAGRALTVYLDLLRPGADELFEARQVLEPLGAQLAAERASDADIEKLRGLLRQLETATDDFNAVFPLHARVRTTIGEAAGNPALTVFVSALSRHSVEAIASQISPGFDAAAAERATRWKRRLVDAIAARAAGEAEAAMRGELKERLAALRTLFAEYDAQVTPSIRAQVAAGPHGDHPKLGQAVAATIIGEIREQGLQPGARLGAEPDLLARYGVSRAVFREAIRILELHGFVRPRRGHAGGLLVSAADPTYAIDSAIIFLSASGMSREHFKTIRHAISVKVASLAAQRIDEAGRGRLRETLDLLLSASGYAIVSASVALHALIGDLGGSRALAVFNRVLLDLNKGTTGAPLPADVNVALKRNSEGLCAAICSGDEVLARRRMVEHMHDVAAWAELGLTVFR